MTGSPTTLRSAFANEFVGVRSYRRSEDQMGENLTRAENYLSLVGLVVLILGGIGVSSVTRVFVQQKLRSIAILKCVGASSREILAVYMTQVLLLGRRRKPARRRDCRGRHRGGAGVGRQHRGTCCRSSTA